MSVRIIHGDCRTVLPTLPAQSVQPQEEPEMAEDMIERVAKAIREVCAEIEVSSNGATDADAMWFAERYARAAIEAMREPTKAMNQAGRQKAYYLGAYLGDGAMALVWREMIDAALSPQARKDETT